MMGKYIACASCHCKAVCDELAQCHNAETYRLQAEQQLAVLRGNGGRWPFPTGGGPPAPAVAGYTPTPDDLGAKPQPQRQPRPQREPGAPAGRPAMGSLTGRVWELADHHLAVAGGTVTPGLRKQVIAACEATGINKSTASVQYGKWLSSRT